MSIGVSGDPGSFSEEAALQYAGAENLKPDIVYLTDMEGVLSAVESGAVQLGIFPVANQRGGLVMMALQAMGRHRFIPVADFWLNVCQCLMVRKGVQLGDIRKVVSHPQGFAQCPAFLKDKLPDAMKVEWQDTAKAAGDLASGKLTTDCAVIAPRRAAELHGLELLAEGIQDLSPNLTAFVVVKRED